MPRDTIRILLIDDHVVVRNGVRLMLGSEADLIIECEADNAQEALRLAREHEFDVALVDIALPGMNGLDLLRHFHRLMSQEISREQSAMLLLGGMRAEQRLAVFLVNVGVRYAARGYSATNFQLRMMREEIGNYLSLTIDSISRLLALFKKNGLLKVANREITVLDPERLRAIAAGTAQCRKTTRLCTHA